MEPVEERLANISFSKEINSAEEDDSHSSEDRNKFMTLVKKSRQMAENGEIARALELNKIALSIHYSEKLERRIQKMEAFLREHDSDSSSEGENKEDMEDIGLGFKLHCSLAGKLYTHQKHGVLWLWTLFKKGKGGILADDMGLGKTIQVIAFLAGMFDMDLIKTVMIVVPLSVMPNWVAEFSKWTPGIHVSQFHGDSRKERQRALQKVRSRGGVMLTTYGLIVTQNEMLAERHGKEFVWDYIILDEGHKIKNATKTSKGIHAIPAKNRIILTGTPVQNNLKELWSLFDYVHQGSLLGTVRTFKMQFETPITRARERDASAVEKRLGQEMSDTLKSIIQPYFLRRTKKEVSDQREMTQDEKCAKMPELTRKNDIVLWVHLTETQQKIYQDFVNLDEVKALLMTKKSPLVALTVLKKVCDHPRLLSSRACMKLGLDGDGFDEEDLEHPDAYESAVSQIDKIRDEVLVDESGKMGILIDLLDNFSREGHKTLVFSQSRKLLDIIEKVIKNKGHKYARIDGRITNVSEREAIVKKFQKNPSYSIFLLTIQVGGVGLTITAADRVIIYDPSWNPAVDAQAVDRAYRIGQTENVVVHRLITCGTVEEKIYRRQVFKDSITRQTTGNTKNPYRYFTKMELKELFTLDDPRFSKTQQQLEEMHSNQRITDEALDMHIAFLNSLDIFGISDHDLMFSQTQLRDDEEEERTDIGPQESSNNEQFIQYKIQQAQTLIAEESSNVLSYEQRSKGVMRFNNSNRTQDNDPVPFQQPQSTLFTQILPVSHGKELIELSDDEVEIIDGQPSPAPIENEIISDSDSDTTDKEELSNESISNVKSKQKGPLSLSVSRSEESRSAVHKRALQPLTEADVVQRSPMNALSKDRSHIISEEILISPDGRCPLIGLEASKSKDQQNAKLSSTPSKSFSSKKLQFTASQSSPLEVMASPPSLVCNSHEKQAGLHKTFFQASTPNDESMSICRNVLAADSPESGAGYMSPLEDSPRSSLNSSRVCRSLSFGVESKIDGPTKCQAESSFKDVINESCDGDEQGAVQTWQGDSDNIQEDVDSTVEEDVDEEANAKFQDLIMVARTLYKCKDYIQSLVYVEEALAIFQEPELEDMALKIRSKIQELNTK